MPLTIIPLLQSQSIKLESVEMLEDLYNGYTAKVMEKYQAIMEQAKRPQDSPAYQYVYETKPTKHIE